MPEEEVWYVSDIPWKDITQRQHHLCRNLAELTKVSYVSANSFTQLRKYEGDLSTNGVHLREFFGLPFTRFWFIKQINFFILFLWLWISLWLKPRKIRLILSHPSQFQLLNLPVSGIYYDYVDDASGFPGMEKLKNKLSSHEKQIFSHCDKVMVSSRLSMEHLEEDVTCPVIFIPNGVDYEHFSVYQPPPLDIYEIKGNKVGFYGAISEWIDFDLLSRMARKLSDIQFIFIGPIHCDVSRLKKYSNVHFLGTRNYGELPGYLQDIPVWIIPFQVNGFTRQVNPVKAYEYLAGRRKVVSTFLPELENLREWICLCTSHDEFICKIEDFIYNPEPLPDPEILKPVLEIYSWKHISYRVLNALSS